MWLHFKAYQIVIRYIDDWWHITPKKKKNYCWIWVNDAWISSSVRPLVSGTILPINKIPTPHITANMKNVPEMICPKPSLNSFLKISVYYNLDEVWL